MSSFIKQNVSDFIGHKTLYETTQKKWSTVDSRKETAEPQSGRNLENREISIGDYNFIDEPWSSTNKAKLGSGS